MGLARPTQARLSGGRSSVPPDKLSGLPHSLASSARASIEGGMVIAIALVVLRLIERVNFVCSCTGRSVGLAPFRILSTYTALLRNISSALNVYDSRPPA